MAFLPLDTQDLRVGLFVKLDCSWFSHPFATSSFKVRTAEDVAIIRGIPKLTLLYDPDQSNPPPDVGKGVVEEPSLSDPERDPLADAEPSEYAGNIGAAKMDRVEASILRHQKLEEAGRAYQQVLRQSTQAIRQIGRGDEAGLNTATTILLDLNAILESEDANIALVELMNTMEMEEGFLAHSVNVGLLSLMVGRELGFQGDDLLALGLCGLLHDVGMVHLVKDIRFTAEGVSINPDSMKQHPLIGKQKLQMCAGIPLKSVEGIEQHHERMDGTGYPRGLRGKEISSYAKVVMVVDEYDDLCNGTNVQGNLTPYDALARMYIHATVDRREEFPLDVLVVLIRILGVYPPGTLVELTDGSIGVVISINADNRTRPHVLLYAPHLPKEEAHIVDLKEDLTLAIGQSLHPSEVRADVRAMLTPQGHAGYFPIRSQPSPRKVSTS